MNGYGIDSMVQSRADAYRANPDGLAKSYANNQQLIDLLALQKLKTEKEAAARQLTLSAQQAPGTVAQQREQELLGLTRNEIAQQTGAIGEQQEQQMMQQAGLSGLPAQNLEPMQGYADGGIIGSTPNLFPSPADAVSAVGSLPNLVPSPADTARIVAWLAEKGIDATKFTAEQIAEVLQNIDTFPGKEGMSAYGTVERPSIGALAEKGLASIMNSTAGTFDGNNTSETTDAMLRAGERGLSGLGNLLSKLIPEGMTDEEIAAETSVTRRRPTGGMTDAEIAAEIGGNYQQPPVVAQPAAPRTSTQDVSGVGGLSSLIPRAAAPATPVEQPALAAPRERSALEIARDERQLANLQTSAIDARKAGQQTAEDFFGPQAEARNARYDEIQRKLQEIDARETDPKARAKEAMREWMRGAANTSGGLSRLLQGGGNQSRAYIDAQEEADKARMMEMFGLEKELGAEELAMARDIFDAGENQVGLNSAASNTALQTVTQMLEGQMNREEEAKFNAERNKLELRQIEAQEARNALEEGRITNAEFQTRVTALGRQYDMMLSGLEAKLSASMPGMPEAAAINDAISALSADYSRAMQELSGGSIPAMGGGSGASVSPEIQALLDKYSQ